MAVTYSRNLRLRIDSNLTANAKYNLERIDLLGASLLIDTMGVVNLRSAGNINIEPESPDVGGSGFGGSVNFGSADHPLASINFHADQVSLGGGIALTDRATGGTTSMALGYKSDLNGSVDTEDRLLLLDLDGADRSLILGADFSVTGANLSFALSAPLDIALPAIDGDPDQVLSTDGMGNWYWQTVSAGGGDVSGFAGFWNTADGASKVLTHGLGSSNLEIQIIDTATDELILVDSVIATSTTLTLTASEAPSNSWRVVALAK